MAERIRDRHATGHRNHVIRFHCACHHAGRRSSGAGRMNRQMPVLLKPFVALTYVLLLSPLAIVVLVSFGPSPNFEFPPSGLTLKWYQAFFANTEFVRAF